MSKYPIEHNVVTAIKNLTLAFMIDHYITKNIGLQRFQEHTYMYNIRYRSILHLLNRKIKTLWKRNLRK